MGIVSEFKRQINLAPLRMVFGAASGLATMHYLGYKPVYLSDPLSIITNIVDAHLVLGNNIYAVGAASFTGGWVLSNLTANIADHTDEALRIIGETLTDSFRAAAAGLGTLYGTAVILAGMNPYVDKPFFNRDKLWRESGILYDDITVESSLRGAAEIFNQATASMLHGFSEGVRAGSVPDATMTGLIPLFALVGAIGFSRLLRTLTYLPAQFANWCSGYGFQYKPGQKLSRNF